MKQYIIFTLIVLILVVSGTYAYLNRTVNPNECKGTLEYCVNKSFEKFKK